MGKIYVMSDIHGAYDRFCKMLDKLHLQQEDTLYILGDVLDRGPEPIRVVQKLMEMPNAVLLAGNHEEMALSCMPLLLNEITEETAAAFDEQSVELLGSWMENGGSTTIRAFYDLDQDEREDVMDFLMDSELGADLLVEGKRYWLVHAGLGKFAVGKSLEDYTLEELVWVRPDYNRAYFENTLVVSGHTPTQYIAENKRPGYIYKGNNHIAIDCGACAEAGRLAAVCLNTGEEFYVE